MGHAKLMEAAPIAFLTLTSLGKGKCHVIRRKIYKEILGKETIFDNL